MGPKTEALAERFYGILAEKTLLNWAKEHEEKQRYLKDVELEMKHTDKRLTAHKDATKNVGNMTQQEITRLEKLMSDLKADLTRSQGEITAHEAVLKQRLKLDKEHALLAAGVYYPGA